MYNRSIGQSPFYYHACSLLSQIYPRNFTLFHRLMEYLSVDERSSCSPCNIILIYDSLNITRLYFRCVSIQFYREADSPFLILLLYYYSSSSGRGDVTRQQSMIVDDRRFVFVLFFFLLANFRWKIPLSSGNVSDISSLFKKLFGKNFFSSRVSNRSFHKS